ncbi:GNAT family acetyltransferase [Legionella steigerwaltii]|uniref:GNAT family acetyltransferase n=1 Tax=Legionella steigerwaltii TaxID=460 RepID=A0A378LAX0_9GAMM|nr:GNAT family N-acetyltransferase [Legionella steigerwaltii]KTD77708.1 GNAT family acetyltransferase [Legionella steigerwaltii]STY23018.1 GNAT family acetyltransferase [Legionella steigerwaltii]
MQKNQDTLIEFHTALPPDIEEIMRKDLVAYETSHGIDVNYKPFCLILKDEAQNACGVLNAFTAFAEIYVDDMWVHQKHRGKGYGKMLLQNLEDRFEGKGFNNINLVTNAFQAPEFYKKCGFQIEFIRVNNKNPKLTKTFFIKYFKNEIQQQGILDKE